MAVQSLTATRDQDRSHTSANPARATVARTVLLSALLVWPLMPRVPYDVLNTAILACEYSVIALSVVLLIGMVGQISLCQAALVGMGAFTSALATNDLQVHFPFTLIVGTVFGALTAAVIGVVALRVRGLYLAVATLIFGYLCDQYLFGQTWLVQNRSGTSIPFETIGKPGTIPSFDLADAHVFYYVALGIAALSLYGLANLRDSRLGRAFAAVRGSEVAAASLGINVVRTKLLGFACAGGLAGLGGALTLAANRTVAPDQFSFVNSLDFLAIAVVGGLRSLGGAVASSLLFALLVGELFFRSPTLADYLDVISSGLLITVLIFFRGGLGAVPQRLSLLRRRMEPVLTRLASVLPRRREIIDGSGGEKNRGQLVDRVAWTIGRALSPLRDASLRLRGRRNVLPDAKSSLEVIDSTDGPLDIAGLAHELSASAGQPQRLGLRVEHFAEQGQEADTGTEESRFDRLVRAASSGDRIAGKRGEDGRRFPILLSAEHITVRFGGLIAVNDASLQVGAGEVVGLIGPNGAGKTTLFNSILGLNNPTQGTVHLYGHDVTTWDVHRRAALGVGRTFQILQLFGDLTVFENLMVATHLQNRTGLWGSLVVSAHAAMREQEAQERVWAVLDMMELTHFAHSQVAGLPFGVLRLIEVARTLVTGARLVCFDEPASGLDSSETEKLLEWFRFLRQIGITLLVIEHDVSFVVRLCDHIYVLDQGRLIAHGTPQQIQRNPDVIASYLGTAVEVA
jgi:ABC-type branched-subunit amino acid transport system ATPase component/ABC-type branched-subunit amino acid transport system permease subunit